MATVARLAALAAHRRTHGPRPERRRPPGSHSWPLLRLEAERRFAANEPPDAVIADLRARHGSGRATVPSVQTMRRWFREARWLDRSAGREHQAADGSGMTEDRPADPADGGNRYTPTGTPPHPMLHIVSPGMRMEVVPPLAAHLFDMSPTGPRR